MEFEDYVTATHETANYPGAKDRWSPEYPNAGKVVEGINYAIHGIVGESGELSEAGPAGALRAELGDVLWYLARLYHHLGVPVFCWAQREPNQRPVSQITIMATAAQLSNTWKKVYRDDGGSLTIEKRSRLAGTVLRLHGLLAARAASFDTELDGDWGLAAIAAENIEHLRDRKARGVIGGDGDDR